MSTFVVVRCYGREKVSLLANRHGVDPQWNQEFILKNIPNVLSSLDVEVYCRKTLGEESLGYACIPVVDAMKGEKIDRSFELYAGPKRSKTISTIRIRLWYDVKKPASETVEEEKPAEVSAPMSVEPVTEATEPSKSETSHRDQTAIDLRNDSNEDGQPEFGKEAEEKAPAKRRTKMQPIPPPVYFPDPDEYVIPPPQFGGAYGGQAAPCNPYQATGYPPQYQGTPNPNHGYNNYPGTYHDTYGPSASAYHTGRRRGNYYQRFRSKPREDKDDDSCFLAGLLALFTICLCEAVFVSP